MRSGQTRAVRDILQACATSPSSSRPAHRDGPRVYEAAIRFDEALKTADRAALFKVALKQIAHRHGAASRSGQVERVAPGSAAICTKACGVTARTHSSTRRPGHVQVSRATSPVSLR